MTTELRQITRIARFDTSADETADIVMAHVFHLKSKYAYLMQQCVSMHVQCC